MVEKSEKEQGNRNDKEEGEDRGGGGATTEVGAGVLLIYEGHDV